MLFEIMSLQMMGDSFQGDWAMKKNKNIQEYNIFYEGSEIEELKLKRGILLSESINDQKRMDRKENSPKNLSQLIRIIFFIILSVIDLNHIMNMLRIMQMWKSWSSQEGC